MKVHSFLLFVPPTSIVVASPTKPPSSATDHCRYTCISTVQLANAIRNAFRAAGKPVADEMRDADKPADPRNRLVADPEELAAYLRIGATLISALSLSPHLLCRGCGSCEGAGVVQELAT